MKVTQIQTATVLMVLRRYYYRTTKEDSGTVKLKGTWHCNLRCPTTVTWAYCYRGWNFWGEGPVTKTSRPGIGFPRNSFKGPSNVIIWISGPRLYDFNTIVLANYYWIWDFQTIRWVALTWLAFVESVWFSRHEKWLSGHRFLKMLGRRSLRETFVLIKYILRRNWTLGVC